MSGSPADRSVSSQAAGREYFECICEDAGHVVRVTPESALFPLGGDPFPTVWIQVQMSPGLPLLKRIWAAIKFVFGIQSTHWAEAILTDGDVERLRDLLDAEIALFSGEKEESPHG